MDKNLVNQLQKETNTTLLDLTSSNYYDGAEQHNWVEFLKASLFLYKYPFDEQLQIYAQTQKRGLKPKAVANLEVWGKFGYQLKNNTLPSKEAINIVDSTGNFKQLFDISQLERIDGKDSELPFKLWDKDLTPEKADVLKNILIQKYELDRKSPDIHNSKLSVVMFLSLESKFERIANENKTKFAVGENISKRVYDDISFTAFISAQVMILARLGSKSGVTKEDVLPNFKMIQDTLPKINTRDTILALGELTSSFAKEMFAEIEIEVKKIEREIKANELNIGMEAFRNEQKRDGNTATEQMGQNASFVSERIQPVGVPEISLQRGTPEPLPARSESDGGTHQPIKQSNSERQDDETENAEQANAAIGVGARNEPHTGNGTKLSDSSDNREQIENEDENNKNSDNKALIGTLEPFDAEIHGKPWACTVSRGRNFFTTKDGEPIGEFVGSNLVGGKVFVTNPQDGRIYGYGLRNKTDVTKSITKYAKYENGAFLPCDRNGNLLEVMAIDDVAEKITEEANKPIIETEAEKEPLSAETTEHEETGETQEIEDSVYSKPDWKEFLEKRTKGIYAKQYREPVVIIEFSESKYFGGYNNFIDTSGYEELSFTAADRKFKEVESRSRAERIEKYGELSGYNKTYGAILYKENPEDTELSVYNFRYDICDYDEQHSGLYNHINNFWKYQKEQAKITSMRNRVYSDETLAFADKFLGLLEPYSANARDSRLQQYFENFPPYKEHKAVGQKTLLPLLFEYNNLNRTGKRTYVTVEEPIGKYQIYSGDGETDREKYAYIMTPANRLLNIGFLDYIKNSTLAKIEIEQRLDNIITYYIEQFEKMINQIEVFIPYDCAAVMNRIDDVIAINDPIMEAKRQKHEKESRIKEKEQKQFEEAEKIRLAEEKRIREDLGGFGDDKSMTPLQKSKVVAFLKDELYNTQAYGVLTNKEFVEKVIADGYEPKIKYSLKKKYDNMDLREMYSEYPQQDGVRFADIRQAREDIFKNNWGVDSEAAKWLLEQNPLIYYKIMNWYIDASFLENPVMKPFVIANYTFEKPLERKGEYSVYSTGITKTLFDYGEFLLKLNSVVAEKSENSAPKVSTQTDISITISDENQNANIDSSYSITYFRIGNNGYQFNGDWDETTMKAFEEERAKILNKLGWSILPFKNSRTLAIATKGKNSLYLHPQNFSGVCENWEREILRNALNHAQFFRCTGIDVYDEVFDMPDDMYLDKLEKQKKAIEADLLELFTTKQSNLYVNLQAVEEKISNKYSIKRLAIPKVPNHNGLDSRTKDICSSFVSDVVDELINSGKLVSSRTKRGLGFRAATKDELQKLESENTQITLPNIANDEEMLLESQVYNELKSRGIALFDSLSLPYDMIAQAITDYKSHSSLLTAEDISDFIEDDYLLSGEPWSEDNLKEEITDKIVIDGVTVAVTGRNDYKKIKDTKQIQNPADIEIDGESLTDDGVAFGQFVTTVIENEEFTKANNRLGEIDRELQDLELQYADNEVPELVGIHWNNLHDERHEVERKVMELNPTISFVKDVGHIKPKTKQHNYKLNEEQLNRTSFGEKSRFKDNLLAIETLKIIENDNRQATDKEQEILAKYVGWGGLSKAFDVNNINWQKEYTELKELLTLEEYKEARESILTAYYTNGAVINSIYTALESIGATKNPLNNDKLSLLEPSLGVGNFFGLFPDELQEKANLYGVEIDSISARIAKLLYPNASIQNMGYEETFAKDYFDIVLGNVPFGDFKLIDKQNPEITAKNFNIHEHFLAKSLDQVKPGGVVVFITSSGTMDKESTETRRYLADRAELLGAIRLPNNAFKGIANTEVTSDIIFLQKRATLLNISKMSETEIAEAVPWIFTDNVSGIKNAVNGESFPINSYFKYNPNMVLGDFIIQQGTLMYGALIPTCKPFEGIELAEQLATAVQNIKPMEAIEPKANGYIGTFEVKQDIDELSDEQPKPPYNKPDRNFSYILGNQGTKGEGKIYFYESPLKVAEDITDSLSDLQKSRLTSLINIKDTTRALIDAQLNNQSDEIIRDLQAKLNEQYDRYTNKHGLINNQVSKRLFSEDASYPLLCALEVLDSDGNFKGKSDMFTKRTINPAIEITHADTAEEALIISMSEHGQIDVGFMEKLTGKSEEDLFTELMGLGLVYKIINRAYGMNNFEYITTNEYLSGNLRAKLLKTESMLEELEKYNNLGFENDNKESAIKVVSDIEITKRNIEALKQAIPKQIEASEIDVRFSSTWIPPQYIADFISETLKLSAYSRDEIGIVYNRFTSAWGFNNKNIYADRVLSTEVYGTTRVDALEIMLSTLNMKDVKIYDTDSKGNRKLNYKETVLAQEKQKKIKREFGEWIWDNSDRRAEIVKIYNNNFNSIRPRIYDGSNLRFEGMNPEIKLKAHQKDAVARILYGGNTLLAHEVGLGKTFEIIAAAMESKRLGLCNKSLITVPKHLTEQFTSDFLKVYPNANVLLVGDNDFTPENRKRFCSKIATGNFDAIVIAHSQFEKIPMSIEHREQFIQDQLDEVEYEIDAENEKDRYERNRFTIKQLERRKKQLEAKLEKMLNEDDKDNTINFEELGVDRVFVDEAHMFKNLYYNSKLTGVAGLSQSESNRAIDMFMKFRYLDETTGGKGCIMATGTPLSNSLSEMYTMQRFLQFDTLEEHGLYGFDDWVSTFGDIVTSYEVAPEGNGKYRERRRFAEFFNLPELMNIFTQVADIKTSDMVDIEKPITNRHTIVAQPCEITKKYIEELSKRADLIRGGSVKPEEDNMLAVTNDGRKIGLDIRLMNNYLPDNPTSKVNMCVQKVFDIWDDTKEDKLTQLLFSDLSTPKAGKDAGFNIYDDVREKLVAKGIPREEIKFIHEAKNDAQKKALFEKVRNGEVRILLGSTEKLGSGTNVQTKLKALHNLDVTWTPKDLEQRIGRISRQGNENKEVDVYNYVTESTFDAYMYQLIENKQKGISQIMTSKEIARRFADIDETVVRPDRA